MKRLAILVIALLIGAAAPARAWCEATCLAPADASSAKPHCPSHEPAPDGASLSADDAADCPSIESARPVLAKLNFAVTVADLAPYARASRHLRASARTNHRTSAPLHLLSIPLRV